MNLKEEFDVAELMKQEATSHEIVRDEHGTMRWVANPVINMLMDANVINIHDLWRSEKFDKGDPIVREFYRDLGYSLFGYWEIFYWEDE